MAGETILVVEDNPLNLKLTCRVLEAEGYELYTAGDADEARAVLSMFMPRLILMDYRLPGMNGLELTEWLKSHPVYQKTPVVALTAHARSEDEQRARKCGCDGFITKPIDTRRFPTQIREFLTEEEAQPAT